MINVSLKDWRRRFLSSYFGWVIMSFIMLICSWLLDVVLGRDAISFTPELIYIVPIACMFGGLFFASIFSLFPGRSNDHRN